MNRLRPPPTALKIGLDLQPINGYVLDALIIYDLSCSPEKSVLKNLITLKMDNDIPLTFGIPAMGLAQSLAGLVPPLPIQNPDTQSL